MFFNKWTYIPEAMVIPSSIFPDMIVICLQQSLSQILYQHLFFPFVLCSKLNEQRYFFSLPCFDKFSCIIFFSLLLRIFEKELISFGTPVRRFSGIGDRWKSWCRFILTCFKGSNKCSMSSHAEPSYWFIGFVNWEIFWNNWW